MAADGSGVRHRAGAPGQRARALSARAARRSAFAATLKTGTLIVSSGLGGIYPARHPDGHGHRRDPDARRSWARTYLLQPAVPPSNIGSVMVLLTAARRRAGSQTVWSRRPPLPPAASPRAIGRRGLARRARAAGAPPRAAPTRRRRLPRGSTPRLAAPAAPVPPRRVATRHVPAPAPRAADRSRRSTGGDRPRRRRHHAPGAASAPDRPSPIPADTTRRDPRPRSSPSARRGLE